MTFGNIKGALTFIYAQPKMTDNTNYLTGFDLPGYYVDSVERFSKGNSDRIRFRIRKENKWITGTSLIAGTYLIREDIVALPSWDPGDPILESYLKELFKHNLKLLAFQ